MLQSLLPKAHQKFRALPLLGSIADGFDDWPATNGYTPGSREFSIRFLPFADTDLRKRGVCDIAKLSQPILYDSWRELIKEFPNHAGTVRTLARYLNNVGIIETGAIEKSRSVTSATLLSDEYVSYLKEVRGCAGSTISHHRLATRSFLDHLEASRVALDSVRWRQGSLRIDQRKTSSPLELPLTNEVAAALVKHLQRTPPTAPYRKVFLRMRAPIGILKPTAITEAFQALVRGSGMKIPFQGPHCLRHSFAVQLLKNGTPLKTIGDILGHRTAESTSVYLRLATGDLREVSLPVPGQRLGDGKGAKR